MINSTSSSQDQDRGPELGAEEISLLNILRFIKGTYKTIAFSGAVGLLAAITYLVSTPKQYEAIAQIAVGQLSVPGNNPIPQGINIEDPSVLIARLGQPTSFTPQVFDACKAVGGANPGEMLAKSIKMVQPKGFTSMVLLKTFAASPQDADACAQAIFELIKTTQAEIIAPYIESMKVRLADDEERLFELRAILAKADKSGLAMGGVYLSTRDEVRFLLDEIATLNSFLVGNKIKVAHLITPIHVSDAPIAPKKPIALASGLIGGLLLGLLLALARQAIAKLKNSMHGR